MIDEKQTSAIHAAMPFARTIGLEVLKNTRDEVRGRVPWSPEYCTSGGVLHGGLLMGLADCLGGACAFLNLPEGSAGTSTIESKTNFFRGVREADGGVTGLSTPLHRGRTTIVVQTDLFDDAGRRVGQVTQTQAVLRPTSASG